MAFLNDLDLLAWAAAFAAVFVSCFVTIANFQDWRNHLKIEVDDGRVKLIMSFGIAFIVGACSSYSPNANAPRKTVEGVARFVAKAQGRHQFDEYICAGSCHLTGGYALDLRDEASDFVNIGSSYVFTYLEKPAGGLLNGISLRVIAISEAGSGRELYKLDLTNHPYRIVAYLLDLSLVVCSGLLGVLLNRRRHRYAHDNAADEEKAEEVRDEKPAGEPISLGLESKDGD